MATSSIFATVRLDSPSVIKSFIDSYDEHVESSSAVSRITPSHIVSSPDAIKKLFKNKFPETK